MQQLVTVHSPESPLRRPAKLVHDMLSDLVRSRELAWRLFVRDISAQYRQSLLGYLWVIVPPLIVGLPFVYMNSQGIIRFNETTIPYAAFALIGTALWQIFVDALNAPLRVITAAKPLLTRINLPREAVLLSGLMQAGFSALLRLPIIAAVMFWFDLYPAPTALLGLLGICALILTGFTIGLILTPLGMLYGDVAQALPVFSTFLMLLTPVVYPKPAEGLAQSVAALNPITPLIMATRDWLTIGSSGHEAGFVVVTLTAMLILGVGWLVLRVTMPHLIARAGS